MSSVRFKKTPPTDHVFGSKLLTEPAQDNEHSLVHRLKLTACKIAF